MRTNLIKGIRASMYPSPYSDRRPPSAGSGISVEQIKQQNQAPEPEPIPTPPTPTPPTPTPSN